MGLEPDICGSEDEARRKALENAKGKWPCYFFDSDTTGEKDFEEFYTEGEVIDRERFESIGVIKNEAVFEDEQLNSFLGRIESTKKLKRWSKKDILEMFLEMVPNFEHQEKDKNLDQKM